MNIKNISGSHLRTPAELNNSSSAETPFPETDLSDHTFQFPILTEKTPRFILKRWYKYSELKLGST